MDYIFPIIVIASIYLFKHQERRHEFECELFYTHEQMQRRIHIPKRDVIDSFLIIFIGLTLLEIGVVFLLTFVKMMMDEAARKIIQNEITTQMVFTTVLLGSGLGMLILGMRSLMLNYRYKRSIKVMSEEIKNPNRN